VLVTLVLWVIVRLPGMTAWWAELLRFVPFPVFLVPPAAALAASWRLRWPWRLAALVSIAIVLVPMMDWHWGRADQGGTPFRLLTLNAKAQVWDVRGERDRRIAAEISTHDADVIVMQDADVLARRLQSLPAPIAKALEGRALYGHGQYVVASRLPMTDCHPQPMPTRDEARDFVRCTLRVGDVDVDLVTAHLISPRVGLNAARREWFDGGLEEWQQNFEDRMAQAAHLLQQLAGTRRPLVLAGDLNASEASPVVRTLKAGLELRDAFASAGRGYGFTHGHSLRPRFSFLRIDHVLVSAAVGVRDCFAGGRDASDHRPVIADLLVRRP